MFNGCPFRIMLPFAFLSFLFVLPSCAAAERRLDKITLPSGFSIEIYAEVPGARSLSRGAGNTIFVGTRDEKVYAITDRNGDGKADRVYTIASDLNEPNGVAYKDGSLFVAEISRVIRFDNIDSNLDSPPRPVVVNASFPTETHHGWKFIRFGPDGWLYVPVGAPCNVCDEKDERFASIMRMSPDGKNPEIFARGIRNTVGFDWHPKTKELWFTDNGRDRMGDDIPPDELNRAPRKGLHFGFPYLHGRNIPDPKFGKKGGNRAFTLPEKELAPHTAALGMRFYTGTMFPETYRNKIFIAEHGSWNRSTPIGYRVTLANPDDAGKGAYTIFAEGWLQNGTSWGRPVDVEVMPDGSLLVSDDKAGVVYRVRYAGGKRGK